MQKWKDDGEAALLQRSPLHGCWENIKWGLKWKAIIFEDISTDSKWKENIIAFLWNWAIIIKLNH